MKKVTATAKVDSTSSANESTNIPDISNRIIDFDTLISWIDTFLIEEDTDGQRASNN